MAVQKFVERGGLKAGERILKAEIFPQEKYPVMDSVEAWV